MKTRRIEQNVELTRGCGCRALDLKTLCISVPQSRTIHPQEKEKTFQKAKKPSKDTAKCKRERSREQGRYTSGDHLVGALPLEPVLDHKLLQPTKNLRADGGHTPTCWSPSTVSRVVDVATGVDAGGNKDDLVELVEEEKGIEQWDDLVKTESCG